MASTIALDTVNLRLEHSEMVDYSFNTVERWLNSRNTTITYVHWLYVFNVSQNQQRGKTEYGLWRQRSEWNEMKEMREWNIVK